MFYPKIGDYVLLRNNKVAKITPEDLPFGTCGINYIVLKGDESRFILQSCSRVSISKILPPVNLDSLRLGNKVRLASGSVWEVDGIDCPTDKSWFRVRFGDEGWNRYNRQGEGGVQSFNIVEIIPQGQPSIRMTLERLTQLVEQRPSAFTEIAQLTGMSVTDLLSDLEKGSSVAWPKPITTPPTKKDADPFGQVAVFDKDTDWMKQEWWAARDMLAAGDIAGWAHTQAWHDASDLWN